MTKIRKKEKEHQELNEMISSICEGGYQDLSPQFASGYVDLIRVHPRVPIRMSEGWRATLVYKNGDIDKYSVIFSEGSILEWHSHLQIKNIKVSAGSFKLYYVAKAYPSNSKDMQENVVVVILHKGDYFHLDSQILHKFEAIESGVCELTFAPPLSAEDNELPDAGDD